jgi:hypothetical protein
MKQYTAQSEKNAFRYGWNGSDGGGLTHETSWPTPAKVFAHDTSSYRSVSLRMWNALAQKGLMSGQELKRLIASAYTCGGRAPAAGAPYTVSQYLGNYLGILWIRTGRGMYQAIPYSGFSCQEWRNIFRRSDAQRERSIKDTVAFLRGYSKKDIDAAVREIRRERYSHI